MNDVSVMYRLEIGWSPTKGYGAVLVDIAGKKMKGIKGNSIRALMRNCSQVIAEEDQKRRRFPLEHEPSRIITPNGF